ncbi:MAG: tetraacyldisaccharide 4'-kinase [Xanthobacteraceae bacterium]
MSEPQFWWTKAGLAASLLMPLAAGYGAVAAMRLRQVGRRVGIPVICIGNLTVGGAGKTPAALACARLLSEAGEVPVFLTRGYGGSAAGPLQVDAARHVAAEVGDEPLLLARAAPTVLARARPAGARLAVALGADVLVMDDGFQNPSLVKDLSVLVVDARRGIGNGKVIPAGPLRASLDVQLQHAQAVLLVGEGVAGNAVAETAYRRALPVFAARLEPDARVIAALGRRPVLAFAGIGDPEKFFATLGQAGADVRTRRAFADHHRYTSADAAALCQQADEEGLTLITTEKDAARLAGAKEARQLAERALALPVTLTFDAPELFRAFLLQRIQRA